MFYRAVINLFLIKEANSLQQYLSRKDYRLLKLILSKHGISENVKKFFNLKKLLFKVPCSTCWNTFKASLSIKPR